MRKRLSGMAGRIRLSDKLTTLYTLCGKSLSIRKQVPARVCGASRGVVMRLAMFAIGNQSPRLGALLDHHVLDLSAAAVVPAPAYFACCMAFLEAGDEALAHAGRLLTTPATALRPVEGVRLCAPVPRPGKDHRHRPQLPRSFPGTGCRTAG